jgi:hypothetical protein
MLSWEEIEIRAVGDKILDVDALKKMTVYHCCDENSKVVKFFWTVLEELEEKEKQLYLQYVWGRSRLPVGNTKLRNRHTIYFDKHANKEALPKSHTCFF